MATREEIKQEQRYKKYGIVGTDPNLDRLAEKGYFQDKIAKGNEILRQSGFPKKVTEAPKEDA